MMPLFLYSRLEWSRSWKGVQILIVRVARDRVWEWQNPLFTLTFTINGTGLTLKLVVLRLAIWRDTVILHLFEELMKNIPRLPTWTRAFRHKYLLSQWGSAEPQRSTVYIVVTPFCKTTSRGWFIESYLIPVLSSDGISPWSPRPSSTPNVWFYQLYRHTPSSGDNLQSRKRT